MKIYQNAMSPNSKRARVIANELGIASDIVSVDFAKGENRTPDYLAKNPMGKVPTIINDEGSTMWESPSILVYYAAKYPDKKLLPTDPRGLADATKWMFWNASHLEAAIFAIAGEHIGNKMMGRPLNQAHVDSEIVNVQRFAPVLNAHLEGHDFICGKSYSIADICLATTVEFALVAKDFVPVDLSPFKHITAWLNRVQSRDAWKKAS